MMPHRRPSPNAPPVEHARWVFERASGTLRSGQARAAGVHPRTLAAMVRSGAIRRLSRGVYQLADLEGSADPDLAIVALKAPGGVVCLISALAFHGLTTQIPHCVYLALPPGARPPKLDHPPVQVYRFGARSLSEGIEAHEVGGATVRLFNAPKSVADCFKFRNRVGLDVALEALRECLRQRCATPAEIMRYAEVDRVGTVMRPYLEAVL